jgi:serine protease Do
MSAARQSSPRLSLALMTAGALLCAGFGACKRSSSNGAPPGDEPIPSAAKPVQSPTTGIATGGGALPPPTSFAASVPNGAPSSFAPLVRTTMPAVVTIYINEKNKRGHTYQRGLGSGFLIDKAGTIVTNNHVATGGSILEVVLADDRKYAAKLLGADLLTDVAVIKIDPPEGVEPLPLGDSDSIAVGDWVVAIGNPLGLQHTVTAGIISAKGRTSKDVPMRLKGNVEPYFDLLQTDAAINQGNSGGPLLNVKGEVIGMNTLVNRAPGAEGLAFAIPINMIKQMIPSLVKEGRLVRSYIGVGIEDAPLDRSTGLRGARVSRVWPKTPADRAGIKEGDLVLAIDGTPVRDSGQMRWFVSIAGVGRKVTLRVLRDEKAFDLPVTLEQLPERTKPTGAAESPATDDDDDDE